MTKEEIAAAEKEKAAATTTTATAEVETAPVEETGGTGSTTTPAAGTTPEANTTSTTKVAKTDNKLVAKKTTTATPAADAVVTAMDKYLIPSIDVLDTSGFTKTKAAQYKSLIDQGYIEADADAGLSDESAFHLMAEGLYGDRDDLGNVEEQHRLTIDTDAIIKTIDADTTLSVAERGRRRRAMREIGKIQDQGMKIVRTASGRHWLENQNDGKREYSALAILEISDALDKYVVKGKTPEIVPEEEEEEDPDGGVTPLIPEGIDETIEFQDYDYYQLAALGVDLSTTLAGLIMKPSGLATAGVGTLAGIVTSVTGDIAATALGAWSDYLNPNVTAGQAWKNAGTRVALGAVEAVTMAPASLASYFGKGAAGVKLIQKGIQIWAVQNAGQTVLAGEWMALTEKPVSDWSMDDMKAAAAMTQAVLMGAGGMKARNRGKKELAPAQRGTDKMAPTTKQPRTKRDIRSSITSSKEIRGARKTAEAANKQPEYISTTLTKKNKNAEVELKKREAAGDTKVAGKIKKDIADRQVKIDGANVKVKANTKTAKDTGTQSKWDHRQRTRKKQTDYEAGDLTRVSTQRTAANNKKGLNRDSKLVPKKTIKEARADKSRKPDSQYNKDHAFGSRTSKRMNDSAHKKAHGFNRKSSDDDVKGVITRKDTEISAIDKKLATNRKKPASDKAARLAKREEKTALQKQKRDAQETKLLGEKQVRLKARKEKITAARKKAPKVKLKERVTGDKSIGKRTGRAADKVKALPGKLWRGQTGSKKLARLNQGISAVTPIHSLATRGAGKSIIANQSKEGEMTQEEATAALKRAGYSDEEIASLDNIQRQRAGRAVVRKMDAHAKGKTEKKHAGGRLLPRTYHNGGQIQKFQVSGQVPIEEKKFYSASPLDAIRHYFFGSDAGTKTPEEIAEIKARGQANLDAQDSALEARNVAPVNNTVADENNIDSGAGDENTNTVKMVMLSEDHPQYVKNGGLANRRFLNSDGTMVSVPADNKTVPTISYNNEGIEIEISAQDVEKMKKEFDHAVTDVSPYAPEGDDKPNVPLVPKTVETIKLVDKSIDKKTNWLDGIVSLTKHVKPSDFMTTGKMVVEDPEFNKTTSPILQSQPVANMTGFSGRMNRAKHITRLDSADAFAQQRHKADAYNRGQAIASELADKNTESIRGQRREALAIKNQNTSSAVAADNENMRAENARIAEQAKGRAAARAKEYADLNQRVGRVVNGLTRFGTETYKNAAVNSAEENYLGMARADNVWKSKYGTAYSAHIKAGENDKAAVLENEFKKEYKYDPHTLGVDMAGSDYIKYRNQQV